MLITEKILRKLIEASHMAGQRDAGATPVYINSKTYANKMLEILDGVERVEKKEEAKKEDKTQMTKECYNCIHKGSVPGSAHIKCSNPDPTMTGDPHGIKSGWFIYPYVFDPTWKTKMCDNFEKE